MSEINTRYQEVKSNIRDRLQNMKNDYVAIGYHLREVLNDELYLEDGYKNVHEFAQSEFGMKKATVNHCIRINMEFSVGGNSPEIDDKYSEFSKSQLQELLYIQKEKREEVTPDMTVRQIREMREDRLDVEPEEEKKNLDDQIPGQDSILNHDEYMPEETEKSWSEEIAVKFYAEHFKAELKEIMKICRQYKNNGDRARKINENFARYGYSYSGCYEYSRTFKNFNEGLTIGRGKEEITMKYGRFVELLNIFDPFAKEFDEKIAPAQKEEKKEEPLSVLGHPKRVYPEGSMLSAKGCGSYDCFSCHRDGCEIRQEDCYCVEAPLGKPFPCTTLNVVENLKNDIGDTCQFINEDLAFHRSGDGQPVPCCKECDNPCGYECRRSVESRNTEKKPHSIAHDEVAEEYSTAIDELELSVRTHNVLKRAGVDTVEELQNMSDSELSKIRNFSQRCMDEVHKKLEEYIIKPDENVIKQDDFVIEANNSTAEPEDTEYSEITIRDYLWEEEKTLEEYERVNNEEKLPLNLMMRQRMLVKALNLLLESGKEVEEPEEEEEIIESVQPELPALKNNDQRKEWLNKYKEWGLWYRDENIDVNYYKYDFSDGSRLVVAEYPQRRMYWKPNEFEDEHYYHLLDKNRKYYGSDKTFEQQYVHSTDSETYMIEFLKNLQKDRKK